MKNTFIKITGISINSETDEVEIIGVRDGIFSDKVHETIMRFSGIEPIFINPDFENGFRNYLSQDNVRQVNIKDLISMRSSINDAISKFMKNNNISPGSLIENIVIERKPVASSNILDVGYNAENLILDIKFVNDENNDRFYRYYGVTGEDYDNLISAESIGHYYHEHIKGVYSCIKFNNGRWDYV